MRFRDYIKDHALIITVYAVSLIVIEIFLKAFGTNVQAMGVVAAVFILMAFVVHIYDFRRRKRFYDVLETSVKELDKKYLLPEVRADGRSACHEVADAMLPADAVHLGERLVERCLKLLKFLPAVVHFLL